MIGFGIAYPITSVLSAQLVVLKESSGIVHEGLTLITGHHWVTHDLLNLIVFLVLGLYSALHGSGRLDPGSCKSIAAAPSRRRLI